ncbi:DoxX family membrane protein [Myxococcota bacterium]|nr:DoxX family membrane protein [Myxococcota bacterium]MBU1536737.1 DoxX family membrane protein [Myxococcota bacterium]
MKPESFICRFWNHWSHPVVGLHFRLVVGIVFVLAAIPKIVDPSSFAWSIALYQMLHYRHVHLLAVILPWVELVAGVFLILGFRTRGSAVVVCGMLVMFIVAIAFAIINKIEMSGCGCFSQEGAKALEAHRSEMGTSLLFRDLAMLVMTGYVWLFDTGRLGLDGVIKRLRK